MARKHTAGPGKVATGRPIVEEKIKLDGTVRSYGCTADYVGDDLAVVRFEMPAGGSAFGDLPVQLPPGAVSRGFFWRRRPYNLYRMRAPSGEVIGHRFDAVTEVQLGVDCVRYRDLILDWWSLPDGRLVAEDDEEFIAALAAGGLTTVRIRAAERSRHLVTRNHRRIIGEAAAIERELGIVQV